MLIIIFFVFFCVLDCSSKPQNNTCKSQKYIAKCEYRSGNNEKNKPVCLAVNKNKSQSITKKNSLVMAICAICDSFKRLFRTKVKKSWRSKWINRRNDSTVWVLPLKRIYALFRITKTEPSGDWWVWLLVLSVNLWKSNKSLFSSP